MSYETFNTWSLSFGLCTYGLPRLYESAHRLGHMTSLFSVSVKARAQSRARLEKKQRGVALKRSQKLRCPAVTPTHHLASWEQAQALYPAQYAKPGTVNSSRCNLPHNSEYRDILKGPPLNILMSYVRVVCIILTKAYR